MTERTSGAHAQYLDDDFDPKLDAFATYIEACRLARNGNDDVRAWFEGRHE